MLDVDEVRWGFNAERNEQKELLCDEDITPEWRLDCDLLALELIAVFAKTVRLRLVLALVLA